MAYFRKLKNICCRRRKMLSGGCFRLFASSMNIESDALHCFMKLFSPPLPRQPPLNNLFLFISSISTISRIGHVNIFD